MARSFTTSTQCNRGCCRRGGEIHSAPPSIGHITAKYLKVRRPCRQSAFNTSIAGLGRSSFHERHYLAVPAVLQGNDLSRRHFWYHSARKDGNMVSVATTSRSFYKLLSRR